jgi:hypothetical protein
MNGAIVVPWKVMREDLSNASEAELAALFYNGKEGAPRFASPLKNWATNSRPPLWSLTTARPTASPTNP